MATLTDEYGAAWQLSSLGVGAVAIGLSDIRQCIDYILRTRKGQDPFRPLFGSDVFEYVDKPFPIARPNISKEIIEALGIWETRIKIKSVKSELDPENIANIKFYVTYALVDQDLEDTYLFNISTGQQSGNSGQLILQCIVPARNTDNDTWFVDFTGNGSAVMPAFPAAGFTTVEAMVPWIQSNWSTYGRWSYTGNKLVLYLKNGIFSSASLDCYINTQYVLKANIPNLDLTIDQFYSVGLIVDGLAALPAFPDGVNTSGDLLSWVQSNWGDYGRWSISNGQLVLTSEEDINGVLAIGVRTEMGGFSLGFNEGFNV